jgi:hypothetical protein
LNKKSNAYSKTNKKPEKKLMETILLTKLTLVQMTDKIYTQDYGITFPDLMYLIRNFRRRGITETGIRA